MNRRSPATLLLGAICLLAVGCASVEKPSPLVYPGPLPELEVAGAPHPVSEGSLFADTGAAELACDFRARHIGDVLTVQINESSIGSSTADSKLDKTASTTLKAPTPLGFANRWKGKVGPDFDPALAFDASNTQAFNGKGATNRGTTLTSLVAVRVMAVGAGGRMVVAGVKQITVNREKQYLTIAGIVRPEDVAAENTIASSAIADLVITYTGKGDLNDVTRQGWFTKLLLKLWPF